MNEKVFYCVNQSSADEITTHLLRADAAFVPVLSSRVSIPVYAQKLHARAVRFEAWMSGELVGLVATYCNQPNSGKAFLTSVSVQPESQGKGIASRLLGQCIEYVRGLGFCQIGLEVDQRSAPAVALYQRVGFRALSGSGSNVIMSMTLVR